LTSLDTFDGTIWKSKGDYEDAGGQLPESVPSEADRITVEQQVEVAALASLWLPAAFEPSSIIAPDIDVVYESASATLIVGSDLESSDGLNYRVISDLPRFDSEELAASEQVVPEDIRERYLELPPDFSDEARALAEQLTAGMTSPYDQARALQDFFQSEFTYNVDVEPGHSSDAIDEFLESREGYCEQFSGTYAAMARSIGLPARVAVGFTPGDLDPANPNQYHVRGEHAHAWPEVFIAGQGWVAFEPTPGRGLPGAEEYTGVPEPEPTTLGGDPTATSLAPTTSTPGGATSTTGAPIDPEAFGGVATGGPEDEGGGGAPWPLRVGLVLVAGAMLVGLYAGVVLLAKRGRRRRRHHRATDRRGQVRALWLDALDAAAVAGVRRRSTETHRELVERMQVRLPVDQDEVDRLAWAVSAADYSPDQPTVRDVDEAERAVRAIRAAVLATSRRADRLRAALDPRPLLRHRRSHVVEDRTRVQPRPI
jgi:transglutaminase-like putative cysteine protease